MVSVFVPNQDAADAAQNAHLTDHSVVGTGYDHCFVWLVTRNESRQNGAVGVNYNDLDVQLLGALNSGQGNAFS